MGLPKRLQAQTPSHARSKVQEKETAIRTGGKQTPRSGAGLIKGDVRVHSIARIEDKTTKHASFSVNVEHIQKLDAAVAGTTELPVMKVELVGGAVEFFVVPGWAFNDFIEILREKHDASKNTSE